MSQYHESCISRFLLLVVWWGAIATAACAEVSTGPVEASKAEHGPGLQNLVPGIYEKVLLILQL
jgi:hypothetical protein